MALNGHDLVITRANGEQKGFFLTQTREFGEPCLTVASAPQVPINIGSATPADTPGGVYDVRDAESEKAITHLDWSLGAGQRSLDAEGASPYMFYSSSCVDVESKGQMKLLREVEYIDHIFASGPMFAFGDYVLMAKSNGDIAYSSDGLQWGTSSWTGNTPTVPVGSFTTDSIYVYVCVPSGDGSGVYRGTLNEGANPWNFEKLGTSSEKVTRVVHNAGMLYASQDYIQGSQDSCVAILDPDNGYEFSTTLVTGEVLSTCSTVALISSGSVVYWVVSQNGRSFVYKLFYDPNVTTPILAYEQCAEFPEGFIATCALSYLSNVYIGGYWKSWVSNRAMGSVYVLVNDVTAPLFDLGERPEHTLVPDDVENDNRIVSMCCGAKDLYVATNRACYRWDIDASGYSHMFDLTGSGYGTQSVVWNSGSDYSWDGTSYYNESPPHQVYPTNWTPSGGSEANWSFSDGTATLGGTQNVILTCTPTGADTMYNETGTTLEFGLSSGAIDVIIKDGAYVGRCTIDASGRSITIPKYAPLWSFVDYTYQEWEYLEDHNWGWVEYTGQRWELNGSYAWTDLYTETATTGFNGVQSSTITGDISTVRINQKGSVFSVAINGDSLTTTTNTMLESTAVKQLSVEFHVGVVLDYMMLNSREAVPAGAEIETLSYAGALYHNGDIYIPYSIESYADPIAITSLGGQVGMMPVIVQTAVPHGFETGDIVVIYGTGDIDIDRTHSFIDVTGPATFELSDEFFDASATGWVYNAARCPDGYAKSWTRYPDEGHLIQSETNFHTGSMEKDFRYIDVLHEPHTGGSLGCTAWIDGDPMNLQGIASRTHTVFKVNRKGYSIKTRLTLYSGPSGSSSPVVKAVNVVWDFVKVKKHKYILECKDGAGGGRWGEDPEEAVQFLFGAADERATFEDQFSGEYDGVVSEVAFSKANRSTLEHPAGIVTLTVREV